MSKNYKDFKADYKYTKFENKVKNIFKSKYIESGRFLFYANIFNAVFNIIVNTNIIAGSIYLLTVLLYFDSFRSILPFIRNNTDRQNKLMIIIVSVIALVFLLVELIPTFI